MAVREAGHAAAEVCRRIQRKRAAVAPRKLDLVGHGDGTFKRSADYA